MICKNDVVIYKYFQKERKKVIFFGGDIGPFGGKRKAFTLEGLSLDSEPSGAVSNG